MKEKSDTDPRVYSYIRFSTPEQKLGDSERRQMTEAEAFAKENDIEFDDTLKDEISSFRGAHRKRGALGRFLLKVKEGKVPKGSILVVEKISRLGREDAVTTLTTIFNDLVKHDVVLQTLHPRVRYDRKALNGPELFSLISFIQLAHKESEEKAYFVKKANAAKLEKTRLTKAPESAICPKWLIPVIDRSSERTKVTRYDIIPAAQRAIQFIFESRLNGWGMTHICKKLNSGRYWVPPLKRRMGQAVPGPSDRWRQSYIVKILRSPAVVGDRQPGELLDGKRRAIGEKLSGIYPAVISRDLYNKVQALLFTKKGKANGGRFAYANNLFTKIVKCAYCGGPMIHQPKGAAGSRMVHLVCDKGRSGPQCDKGYSVRYDEFQETVLNNCSMLRPEMVLPKDDIHVNQCIELREQIAALVAMKAECFRRANNLQDHVARTSIAADQDLYAKDARTQREAAAKLEIDIREKTEKLRALEQSRGSLEKWTADLAALKTAIVGKSDKAIETRSALREHLREFILKVEVFADGLKKPATGQKPAAMSHLPRFPKMEADRGEWQRWRTEARQARILPTTTEYAEGWLDAILDEHPLPGVSESKLRKFRHFFTHRLMTRKARFFRLHLKTGVVLDLVPSGSIAMGHSLTNAEESPGKRRHLVFIYPPMGHLWTEFESEPQRRKNRLRMARKRAAL